MPARSVSPADGRIVAVEHADDPYLERSAIKVSVFMNVFNVHSNRSPVDGEVKQSWYHPGAFVNAALDKASLENERAALWIKADAAPMSPACRSQGSSPGGSSATRKRASGSRRGDRFGFIRFGSRVDVYLPVGARVKVALGRQESGRRAPRSRSC